MIPAETQDNFVSRASTKTKVVVATTVMLSFISFWRAAAIVLSDLASSAYYAGGIAETQIGKSAPWFILAVMLFSYAVRAIYVESCSMFVRGGVYKVVHEAMGGTLAKISVSALMFDYILTGPISGVSAGLYLAGILNEMGERFHIASLHFYPPWFAAAFAVLATLYFWRKNILGMHESSEKALRIMQITTVMVVILIGWCLLTMGMNGFQPVPLPIKANLKLGPDSRGLAQGHDRPHDYRGGYSDRLGALAARDERFRDARPGLPRARVTEAEESEARGQRDFSLQHAVHVAGFVLRGDADPGFGTPEVSEQPAGRTVDVSGWPRGAEAAVPHFRGGGGNADPRGRRKYRDHRLEWRAQPRGGRRRSAQLVS